MAQQRVTIGFSGGSQGLAVRLDDADLDDLLKALPGGQWHDLTTADGTIRLNLGQVVYVSTSRDEHRVGFGAG